MVALDLEHRNATHYLIWVAAVEFKVLFPTASTSGALARDGVALNERHSSRLRLVAPHPLADARAMEGGER